MLFQLSSARSVKIKIGNQDFVIQKGKSQIEVLSKFVDIFKERCRVHEIEFFIVSSVNPEQDRKFLLEHAKTLGLNPAHNISIEKLKALILDAENTDNPNINNSPTGQDVTNLSQNVNDNNS